MIYSNPIKINENYSYTHNDIGLILYESEMNSMRIFEATLQADFAQIAGLREGTLLESEVEAIKESNFADFKKKIVTLLETFWRKIKSGLIEFKNKLLEIFESNGKHFIIHFFKTINKNYKHRLSKNIEVTRFHYDKKSFFKNTFYSIPVLDGAKNFADYCKAWYTQFSRLECNTEADFISYIYTNCTYTELITPSHVLNETIRILTGDIVESKSEIKCINNFVKELDIRINSVKKYLINNTNDSDLINNYNISVSACQKVISTIQSTFIKAIRDSNKSLRNALQEILNDVCHGEKDDSELYYHEADLSYFIPRHDIVEEIIENSESYEDEDYESIEAPILRGS